MALVATGYLAAIALVLWQHLYLPVHYDEFFYSRRFVALQRAGWLTSLAQGDPAGYYAIVRLVGADTNFLFVGRAVSLISTGLVFAACGASPRAWSLESRARLRCSRS